MKSKKLNLGKWMFMLSGILLIALSSCSKDDDLTISDQPALNPNDAIPSFHQNVDDEYKDYISQ